MRITVYLCRMQQTITGWQDTIVALATPQGLGAIGVIRLSGAAAISIANRLFPSKDLTAQPSHTIHVGWLKDEKGTDIDEVVISLFKNPRSYTGEDVVEISCHGSAYVQQQIIHACIAAGARMAGAGEFTQRAFLNGKLNLAQAEAVADIIASESEAGHRTALQQMKTGFANEMKSLREQLVNFASLVELELDFAEEDVEFANRDKFNELLQEIRRYLEKLIHSFKMGNAIKTGITTVIAGRPNAGKSTLLNALLNDERAIVSDIAGTTRDVIEEKIVINGLVFRLIDTAGIREATDVIERMGVERSLQQIGNASILLYVFDAITSSELEILEDIGKLNIAGQKLLLIANKADLCEEAALGMLRFSINEGAGNDYTIFEISALRKDKVDELKEYLGAVALDERIDSSQPLITNIRHYQALKDAAAAVEKVQEAFRAGLSTDLVALDIREAIYALGLITGEVTNDEILGNIFSKFCIGK